MPTIGRSPSSRVPATRGIYDNMKTVVDAIYVGKERKYNRRFLQMCSHYLVDPVACTPASGWEKGQVENQVGVVRGRLFKPRVRAKSYEELNGWLLDRCVAYAKAHRHPERKEQTIWDAFEAERGQLVPYAGRFDGFHAVPGDGVEDLLGALRQQQVLGRGERGGTTGRGPGIRRPDRSPPGRQSRGPSTSAPSAGASRSTIPGTTCPCWRGNRARCATVRPSRTGCCRLRSNE